MEGQGAFLDRVGEDDPECAGAELSSLLRYSDPEAAPLEDIVNQALTPVVEDLQNSDDGPGNLSNLMSGVETVWTHSWIGKSVAHFEIIELLGRGGMGVVFKARDQQLRRMTALKFLPPSLIANEDAKARFITEARAASSIDHPNIATIYEIGETPDAGLFIAMAYYEGETLEKKIARGPIPPGQALAIAIQLSDGLSEAHQKDVVHRDIKPGNILVCEDGTAKLLDFGIAKLLNAASLTQTGKTSGTAYYMSPEQARGEPVDHRSDLWSVGVILYEMLSGVKPFSGETGYAVVYSVIHDELKSQFPQMKSKSIRG